MVVCRVSLNRVLVLLWLEFQWRTMWLEYKSVSEIVAVIFLWSFVNHYDECRVMWFSWLGGTNRVLWLWIHVWYIIYRIYSHTRKKYCLQWLKSQKEVIFFGDSKIKNLQKKDHQNFLFRDYYFAFKLNRIALKKTS